MSGNDEMIAVRVPANIKEKLNQIALQKDRSISYLVRSVILNALRGLV